MTTETFDWDALEAEYQRLGYRFGWTFMMTPEARLRDGRVAIVGLNPGGGKEGEEGQYTGQWDCPRRNAYYEAGWGDGEPATPIQAQVRAWHSVLDLEETDTLCAQFVPFRSPTWAQLERKDEALEFSSRLWRWVLEQSPASLIITMGRVAADRISVLLNGHHVAQLPTGWGEMKIDVWDSPSGRRIVNLPHPSRYRLFNRRAGTSRTAEGSLRTAAGLTA